MIPLNRPGYQRGCYYVPTATGLVRLRLATAGGNGTTDAVLGHITAHAYLRMDPTASCPACPEYASAGCQLPANLFASQTWSTFADFAAWQTYLAAIPFTAPIAYADYEGDALAPTVTIDGTQSLKWDSATTSGSYTDLGGHTSPEPTDVTLLLRVRLSDITNTAALPSTTPTGGWAIATSFCRGNTIHLAIRNTHDLVISWRTSLSPAAATYSVIGTNADVCGEVDREILFRHWVISASYVGVQVYIHDPCGTPTLVYENTTIPNLDGVTTQASGYGFYYLYPDTGTTTGGAVWLHQVAIADDPADVGITP